MGQKTRSQSSALFFPLTTLLCLFHPPTSIQITSDSGHCPQVLSLTLLFLAVLPPAPRPGCRHYLPPAADQSALPALLSRLHLRSFLHMQPEGPFRAVNLTKSLPWLKPSDSSSVNLKRRPLKLPLSPPVCPTFPGFLAAHPSTRPSSLPVGALLTQKKPNFPTASPSSAGTLHYFLTREALWQHSLETVLPMTTPLASYGSQFGGPMFYCL